MSLRSRFRVGQKVKELITRGPALGGGQWVEVTVVSFSPGDNYVHVAREGAPGATALSESEARKRLLAPGEDPVLVKLTTKQRALYDELVAGKYYLYGSEVAIGRKLERAGLVKIEDNGEMILSGRSDRERWACSVVERAPKTRVMIMMLDYSGLPRAWGAADTEDAARAEAKRQLESYCAKQREYGEPMLADPDSYEEKVTLVDEDGKEIKK